MGSRTIAGRLLEVIDHDILPLTERGVAAGNKVFGAAILRKDDLSLVVAGTNHETVNPLLHGEVRTLNEFYGMAEFHGMAGRPETRDLIFLASHEPCTLCMSAITWAGFDNFYYLFSHQDSRDSFAIPHDLRILHEVFGLEPGGYRHSNAYWTAYSIPGLIESEDQPLRGDLAAKQQRIRDRYAGLSQRYQESKSSNAIPLK
ncbi:MAG: nucleoside deaminase [Mycobacterium sp.]|nr:nucleoside deaminase [Mycobacterium sp.]